MKKIIITLAALLIVNCQLIIDNCFSQNISINTDATPAEANVMLDVKGTNSYSTTATQNIFQVKSFDASGSELKMRMILGTNATATSRYGGLEVYDAASSAYRNLALQPNGGNVGIGTSAPDALLNVFSPGAFAVHIDRYNVAGPGTNNIAVVMRFRTENSASAIIEAGAIAGRMLDVATNASELTFSTNSGAASATQKLWIKPDGKIGVGVSGPLNMMDVAGSMAIGLAYAGNNTAPANGLLVQGNLGIGTPSPSSRLEVYDGDLTIKGSPASPDDPGDIIFQNNSGALKARVWSLTTAGTGLLLNGDGTLVSDMVIDASGRVGIGTLSPGYILDVTGNTRLNGVIRGNAGPSGLGASLEDRGNDNVISFDWTGAQVDCYVDGTNTGKSFVIEHPSDKNKYLVHATLEGPENTVFYRGTAHLNNGKVEITLPDYFEALTQEEGRTIMLTNVGGFDRLMVEESNDRKIINGKFTVVAENPNSMQKFDWLVMAIRKDIPPLVVEPEKTSVMVKGIGPYKYLVPIRQQSAELKNQMGFKGR